MPTITVDVDIDDFDDGQILEAAIRVLGCLGKDAANPGMKKRLGELRVALAKAEEPSDGELITTAMTLKDDFELKRYVRDHPELYHFAGSPP